MTDPFRLPRRPTVIESAAQVDRIVLSQPTLVAQSSSTGLEDDSGSRVRRKVWSLRTCTPQFGEGIQQPTAAAEATRSRSVERRWWGSKRTVLSPARPSETKDCQTWGQHWSLPSTLGQNWTTEVVQARGPRPQELPHFWLSKIGLDSPSHRQLLANPRIWHPLCHPTQHQSRFWNLLHVKTAAKVIFR